MKVGIVEQSLSTSGKEGFLFKGVVVFCQVSVFNILLLIACETYGPNIVSFIYLIYLIMFSFTLCMRLFSPQLAVDSDDAMGVNTSILSSPTPPSAGPYGKEIGGTPPQSPSVSTALSGAGYDNTTTVL